MASRLPFTGRELVGGILLLSVTHGQCGARHTGYVSSRRAPPPRVPVRFVPVAAKKRGGRESNERRLSGKSGAVTTMPPSRT